MCIPGLHITQGIFQKLFELFEEACHNLDLQLALHRQGYTNCGPEFEKYCKVLKEISTVRHDLELAEQERDTLEQLVTYCSLTYTDSTRELKGLTELSGISNDRVEGLVRVKLNAADLITGANFLGTQVDRVDGFSS